MDDIYRKNLSSLKARDIALYEKLNKIETNIKFEVFRSEKPTEINVLDIEREKWVCHSDAKDLEARQEALKYYREYPFLYFFGLGNGLIIEDLLRNDKHKQIIVIEPDIEMVYIALNFMDVSGDLETNRLKIILQEDFSFITAIEVFHSSNARFYARLFKLQTVGDYYLVDRIESYKTVFDIFLKTIEHIVKAFGNNVGDSLMGLKHHIKNFPIMISHPKYSELKSSKNSDLAVIVSTGPSLQKQLNTLKDIASYVTIISVDASFPILVKHGIKPDIVVSMERDEPTSKFFKETTKEDHDNVIFLCASLQHESVLNSIKSGQLLLSMRPFPYNYYFNLDEYGYVCGGMSSANMAHELAAQMGFKTCAFIGQDLAYGKDGASHSKGHVFGADQIKDGVNKASNNAKYDTIELPAYGGSGMVDSMMFWEIFLRFIEQTIEQTKGHMLTINSTEGGVRIGGSVELPFSEVVQKYKLKHKKTAIVLTDLSVKTIDENMKLVQTKIRTILEEGKILQERIEEAFLVIANACKDLEKLEKEEALKLFDIGRTILLLDKISEIRNYIDKNELYRDFIASISQAVLFNEEFKLAQIKVTYVDNPEANQLKAIQWILEHRYWLFSLSGVIENILHIVEEQSQPYMD